MKFVITCRTFSLTVTFFPSPKSFLLTFAVLFVAAVRAVLTSVADAAQWYTVDVIGTAKFLRAACLKERGQEDSDKARVSINQLINQFAFQEPRGLKITDLDHRRR